jgi:hypothetical protein
MSKIARLLLAFLALVSPASALVGKASASGWQIA